MSRFPRRNRPAAWALPLALLLTACERPAGEPSADTSRPGPVADTARASHESPGIALEQSCTNERYGFRVEYPRGWLTNRGDVLPACSAFDPLDVALPAASEVPTGIAIVITREALSFDRVTDFAGDPSVEVLSVEETTVDGRRAIVAELEHTGFGLYDAGHRHYGYFLDVDPHTVIGVTHGDPDADPPPYAERQRILAAMMTGLRLRSPE